MFRQGKEKIILLLERGNFVLTDQEGYVVIASDCRKASNTASSLGMKCKNISLEHLSWSTIVIKVNKKG